MLPDDVPFLGRGGSPLQSDAAAAWRTGPCLHQCTSTRLIAVHRFVDVAVCVRSVLSAVQEARCYQVSICAGSLLPCRCGCSLTLADLAANPAGTRTLWTRLWILRGISCGTSRQPAPMCKPPVSAASISIPVLDLSFSPFTHGACACVLSCSALNRPFDVEAAKQWMPVSLYVGECALLLGPRQAVACSLGPALFPFFHSFPQAASSTRCFIFSTRASSPASSTRKASSRPHHRVAAAVSLLPH